MFDWVVLAMIFAVWAFGDERAAASPTWWHVAGPGGLALLVAFAWAWCQLASVLLRRHGARPVEEQWLDARTSGRVRAAFSLAARGDSGVALLRIALAAFFALAIASGWHDALHRWLGSAWAADIVAVGSGVIAAVAAEGSRVLIWRGWTAQRGGRRRPLLRELGRFVVQHVQQRVALVLLVAAVGVGWTLAVRSMLGGLDPGVAQPLAVALDFAGLAVVLVTMPAVLAVVWPTTPVRDERLRRSIARVATAAGVSLGRARLWLAPGGGVNAAMVGFSRFGRVLLMSIGATRALTSRELEAVLAHEAAHAQRRHAPWLIAAIAGAAGVGWFSASLLALAIAPLLFEDPATIDDVTRWSAYAISGGLGMVMFGVASRAFEREADATAAETLSRLEPAPADQPAAGDADLDAAITHAQPTPAEPDPDARPGAIRRDAATQMAHTLLTVAQVNGIRTAHWGYRHGSIAQRVRSLERAVHHTAAASPAGVAARRVRIIGVALLAICVVIILVTA